ncbi:hypothetical protein DL96DRAFT_323537 [Flagelloscypha sp. PMI_526]|nr:hypothetical protein DL96DRAFT_323537 [Flagelloscypha sp. PMI_526]
MNYLAQASRHLIHSRAWSSPSLLPTTFGSRLVQLRHSSTSRLESQQPESSPKLTKSKPKQTTPLRRSASASLPIRSASPRSEIRPVFTITTAERYTSFARLRSHGKMHPDAQAVHDAWWIPKWRSGEREGEIFIFQNGTFVCWGLEEAEVLQFKKDILDTTPGFEVAPLKEYETEELEFIHDPSQTTRLQGDLIVLGQPVTISEEDTSLGDLPPTLLPQDTLLARYAFSQALARSNALSGIEEALEEYLSSMSALPLSLQQTGKPGMSRLALIKKLGELMRFRQGLNLNRENFSDVPDLYWSERDLEKLFNSLSGALEIRSRLRAVNEKIDYAAELQSTLRQLLTESSSHRMELVIIALIACELIVALIRDGPELWHLIAGEEPKDSAVVE